MRPSQLPEIRELMSRDYRADVRRLNELLNIRCDAGLEEIPPKPYTGDIDSMERGNCICLIGINPQFPAPSREKPHRLEIGPTKETIARFHSGEEGAYQEFTNSRLDYFRGDMANWVHYGKLAEGYAESFFPDKDHKSVWQENAFAIDILPYWSTDTSKISESRHRNNIDKDPALVLHQAMISRLIEATQPCMIHVNGMEAGNPVNTRYCSSSLKKWKGHGMDKNLMFGHASFGATVVPVMTHNQFGQWTSHRKYWSGFVDAWEEWRDS